MLKLYLDSMLKLYYHLHDCETKLTMDMVKTWETLSWLIMSGIKL